jgi:hypothetical protein
MKGGIVLLNIAMYASGGLILFVKMKAKDNE